MDSNPKLSPLQVETDQAGDMTVKKVLSSLKRHGLHAAHVEKRYHRKQAVRTATTSTNQQNVCNRCIVELVVPELDFTPIKDDADDTRTRDDVTKTSPSASSPTSTH